MNEQIMSAIEAYDERDYIEEFAGADYSKFFGEANAARCFNNEAKYNQKLVHDYSCTGQASCGVVSDVVGFALPVTFRGKVWQRQLATGATEKGDTFSNGMKQTVKQFNEDYPELPYKLAYYRIPDVMSDNLFNILANGSSVLAGYKGKLYRDAQDNGVIDNTDNPSGYGHCIRIVKAWKEGKDIFIKYCDNYEGVNTYNIIKIPKFNKNKDFFKGGYYVKKVSK